MKITKEQLRKMIKEAVWQDREVAKSTELDLARDAARPADPIGPTEAYRVVAALEDLGFVTTRGGRSRFHDFLRELEDSGDLRRK